MYNAEYYNKEKFNKKLDYAVIFRFGSSRCLAYKEFDNFKSSDEYEHIYNLAYRSFYDKSEKAGLDYSMSQYVRFWRSYAENCKKRLPSINQLIQLCNILDCDMDYFITDQEELRTDIASVSEITGLSYENTEKLVHLKYIERQALNALVSHEEFANLLRQISRYLRMDFIRNIDNLMVGKGMEFDVAMLRQNDGLPTKAINKFYVTDGISMILEDLDKKYYNIEKQSDFERSLIDEIMDIVQKSNDTPHSVRISDKSRFDVCQELLGRINPTSIYATLSMDELKNKK